MSGRNSQANSAIVAVNVSANRGLSSWAGSRGQQAETVKIDASDRIVRCRGTRGSMSYTYKNGPWQLVWQEEHPTRSAATAREREIKRKKSAVWIRQHLLNGRVPINRAPAQGTLARSKAFPSHAVVTNEGNALFGPDDQRGAITASDSSAWCHRVPGRSDSTACHWSAACASCPRQRRPVPDPLRRGAACVRRSSPRCCSRCLRRPEC